MFFDLNSHWGKKKEGLRILQNATLLYCRAALLNKMQPFFTVGLRF